MKYIMLALLVLVAALVSLEAAESWKPVSVEDVMDCMPKSIFDFLAQHVPDMEKPDYTAVGRDAQQ